MKTIMACGEGVGDVGTREWDAKSGCHVHLDGWMQPIIRMTSKEDVTITARRLAQIVMLKRPAQLKPIPKGHSDKAAMAKLIAGTEGYDVVVFMTDADTNSEAQRREKVKEIELGFSMISNTVVAIACVPKSTSESWLLSDEKAWETIGLKDKKNFPKGCPEDLWGVRTSPHDNHPHQVFSRVAADANQTDSRDTRNRIGELSNVNALKQRCPTSFVEFSAQMQKV